jgi:DNA-binding NarL/FixJ family response regulator
MKARSPKPLAKSRILVADEQPLLRAGVVHFINRKDDLVVCGEADSIASARTEAARLVPDLLLLDLQLGSGDTIDLIKDFKIQHPSMAILVFSQFDETLFAEKALRAGAMGYVLKQEATEEVLTAVRTVLNGTMYVSRQIAVLILQKSLGNPLQSTATNDVTVEKLSDRELHVFQRLGARVATRQIAVELKLSIKTIETHRENIKHKLGLGNGSELVECATDWVKSNFLPNSNGGAGSDRRTL